MAKIKIEEFFVEGSEAQKSHVLIHIAEPNTPEEEKRGYFLALAEINHNNPLQISSLQTIIEEIEKKYYENKTSETELENLFEKIISQVNKRSSEVLNDSDSEINCLIANIKGDKIIFAYHGYPKTRLFFKKEETIEEIKIIDSPAFSNNQLFCSIIEGNINPNDILFIYTPKIEDNFDINKIKKLLLEKNISEIKNYVEKSLEIFESIYSFGGIFLEIEKETENKLVEQVIPEQKITSQASLENLQNTEDSTSAILSPSLLTIISKKIRNLKFKKHKKKQEIKTTRHGSIETNVRKHHEHEEEKLLNKFLISFGKIIFIIFKYILKITTNFLSATRNFFVTLFFIISNKNGKRTIILDRYNTKINQNKNKFNNIGVLPKIFFISILILILIFIANLFYLKIQEKKEAEKAQYTNLVTIIEEKIDEAKSKLLYNEESKAFELLQEAETVKNSLKLNNEEERINEKQQIEEKINDLLMQLRKITIIKPEIVAEIKNNENTPVSVEKIIYIEDSEFLIYGLNDKNIYYLNPISKNIEIKNNQTYQNLKIAKNEPEKNLVYFIYNNNKLLEYNTKNKTFMSKDISYPNENTEIIDFEIYNNRIYSFDKNNQQIYKHDLTQTGFSKGEKWILEENLNLQDISSIAIDSNIFLLGNGQNIYKFNRGKNINFEITGIDPIIEKATKLWTNFDSSYLYILDSENKRVIIVDKDGHFISQFLAQNWLNPKDMLVIEKYKTIYVLDENTIYKFEY